MLQIGVQSIKVFDHDEDSHAEGIVDDASALGTAVPARASNTPGIPRKLFAHINNLLLVIKVSRLLEPTKDEVVNSFCFSRFFIHKQSGFKRKAPCREHHRQEDYQRNRKAHQNLKRYKMVRARGIEPRPQAWEAHVLPIYYARTNEHLILLSIACPSKGKFPFWFANPFLSPLIWFVALNDIIPIDALFEGNPDKGRKKKKSTVRPSHRL